MLFFFACNKTEELIEPQVESIKLEISKVNQKLIDDFIDQGKRRGGVRLIEGMLHFNSSDAMSTFYENLKVLSDSWDYSGRGETPYDDDFLGDPAITLYYQSIGFRCLQDEYNTLEQDDENYRENVDYYIGSPRKQLLLSSQREIAIGNEIYVDLPMNQQAVISNLSIEGLQDVREKGLFSAHPDVKYIVKETGERRKLIEEDDDGDGCWTNLYVTKKTFVGWDANKLELRLYMSPCTFGGQTPQNVQYTIEWGDGTTTYSSQGTHAYATPNFIFGDCHTFNIKITGKLLSACGGCPAGYTVTRTFNVTLCPWEDCDNYEGEKERSKTMVVNGTTYKMVSEMGIDNSVFIPFDWNKEIWAKNTFYRRKSNGKYKKHVPSKEIGVKLYGYFSLQDDCLQTYELDKTKVQKKKDVYVEQQTNVNEIYIQETGPYQAYSDHWVEHYGVVREILGFTLL